MLTYDVPEAQVDVPVADVCRVCGKKLPTNPVPLDGSFVCNDTCADALLESCPQLHGPWRNLFYAIKEIVE